MKYEPYLEPEQLSPLDRWCKWFSIIVGIPLILFWILSLFGCGTTRAYWVRVYEPVKITAIRFVDKPCGQDWNGCNSRGTGVVQLRRGMSETERWCALGHEKKHLAGYDHPGHTHALALDCGNGEIL